MTHPMTTVAHTEGPRGQKARNFACGKQNNAMIASVLKEPKVDVRSVCPWNGVEAEVGWRRGLGLWFVKPRQLRHLILKQQTSRYIERSSERCSTMMTSFVTMSVGDQKGGDINPSISHHMTITLPT